MRDRLVLEALLRVSDAEVVVGVGQIGLDRERRLVLPDCQIDRSLALVEDNRPRPSGRCYGLAQKSLSIQATGVSFRIISGVEMTRDQRVPKYPMRVKCARLAQNSVGETTFSDQLDKSLGHIETETVDG